MTPNDKYKLLSHLAVLANDLNNYVHHGDFFAKNLSRKMPALKEALVLADTFPSSGIFTSEMADYPEATDQVSSDNIRLLQGLLSLELTEKQYAEIFESFPVNARKKASRAMAFIGRELQIFVSHELADRNDGEAP